VKSWRVLSLFVLSALAGQLASVGQQVQLTSSLPSSSPSIFPFSQFCNSLFLYHTFNSCINISSYIHVQLFLSKWSSDGLHVLHSLSGYIARLTLLTFLSTFAQTLKSLASIEIQVITLLHTHSLSLSLILISVSKHYPPAFCHI